MNCSRDGLITQFQSPWNRLRTKFTRFVSSSESLWRVGYFRRFRRQVTVKPSTVVVRSEEITATAETTIRRCSVIFTSTGSRVATSTREGGRRVDRFESPNGPVEVDVMDSSVPLAVSLQATGSSALGSGTRCAIPLVLQWQASDLSLPAGASLTWTLRLRAPGE